MAGFVPSKEKEEANTRKLVEENPEQAGSKYMEAQQETCPT